MMKPSILERIMGRLGFVSRRKSGEYRLLTESWDREMGVPALANVGEFLKQYGESGWVYVCGNKIAMKASSPKLLLFQVQADGTEVEVKKHIVLDTWHKPNDAMSELQMRHLLHLQLELCGEAFWYIARNIVNGPAQFLPLRPDCMTIIPGVDELVKGYLFESGGKKIAFEPQEIIHFAYPNPDPTHFLRGASPLKAAVYPVAVNQNALIWNYNFFKNGATPSGYLATEARLEDPEVQRLIGLWERQHKGQSNWHKVAVAQQGMKYMELGLGHRDMDFIKQLDKSRDEILAILGVPKSIAGIVEDVNRANAYQDELNFATYKITPVLDFVASSLNSFLLPQFDESLVCRFENIMPRDMEFQLRRHQTYLDKMVFTINEVREELGLEPKPWGDVPWVSMTMVPITESGNDGEPDNPPSSSIDLSKTGPCTPYSIVHSTVHATDPGVSDIRALGKRGGNPWREYVRRTDRRTNVLRPKILKWVDGLEAEVRSHIRGGKTVKGEYEYLFDVKAAAAKLKPVLRAAGLSSATAEANVLAASVGLTPELGGRTEAELVGWARTRATRFSFDVAVETNELLRETLNAGVEAGETIDQLSDRVGDVFTQLQGFRTERIARTESQCASSMGREAYIKNTEEIEGKEWLTAEDERVRDSHIYANGQIVAKDEEFTLGSGVTTKGPGLSGYAEEDINCRCIQLPVMKERGE